MSKPALLQAQLSASPDGQYRLEVSLSLTAGVTVLMGPSGAGKSTILDLLAGHRLPDAGRIVLGDTVLLHKQADLPPSVLVGPEKRQIGYVMQQPMLFPHLSVGQNLAYGIALHPKADQAARVRELAQTLALESLLLRKPSELSGGQRQRVALGRALATRPRALLLDEPLSAVDLGQRTELLERLKELLADLRIPVLYVTHSQEEQRFWDAPTLALTPRTATPSCVTVAPLSR
jgi:molybdate transport system ATP-binding protein